MKKFLLSLMCLAALTCAAVNQAPAQVDVALSVLPMEGQILLARADVTAPEAVAPVAAEESDQAPAWLQDTVNSLASKYPWVIGVLSVIGVFRVVADPLDGLIRWVIRTTKNTKDDEYLAKYDASPVKRWLGIAVNWLFSINLPGGKK